jgi:uncharacterized protein (DUF305 family)
MKMRPVAVLAFIVGLPALAIAAEMHDDMGGMSMGDSDAAKAFAAANEKMMKDMQVVSTGDVDKDFVTMMIPHHQGAIDMAKIELQYGKDPEIRKLAEAIVAAQEEEIAGMKGWLARH